MKAVYISEFGSDLDNLQVREVPDPGDPGTGEVLVRVHAAGLNRADLLQARGLYPPPKGFSPHIPGLEFAGEIVTLGSDVTGWNAGDRVFAITAGEAQAEFALIDHRLLMKVPDALGLTEAAAVPEAFITAYDAVFFQAGLREGETLLVHAVGSGVGLAALQLARSLGATVIGTSRTAEKLEKCRDLGLDLGIHVQEVKDLAAAVLENTGGRGADVILDLVGAAYFRQNLASLAVKGRLMLVGLASGATAEFELSKALQKRAKIIGTVLRSRSIEEKAEATKSFADYTLPLLAGGRVIPNVDRVFPVADAAEAYKYLGSNESFGKVVIDFSS
jgi:NADPH:quinone reductase